MGWENRGGRRYYYRAKRIGRRVVKTYVGGGAIGAQAEATDLERRETRATDEGPPEDDAELDRLDQEIARGLESLGLHRPKRGRWRRRRDSTPH